MAAGTCASLCSTLLLAVVFVFVSADQDITVQYGQSITLPCRAPNDKGSIRAVRWNKPDLQNKNVYLYVDGRFDPEDQHPSFTNRVDLQDKEMKNGDASLILRDVTAGDSGAYECLTRVLLSATRSSNNHISNITIIYLRVDPPGPPAASVGQIGGLLVSAVLLLGVVLFIHNSRN